MTTVGIKGLTTTDILCYTFTALSCVLGD